MKKTAIVAVLALALTLALAACGDDDDSSSAATTTTTSEAPATSSTTTTAAPAGPQVTDAVGTAKAWLQAIADGDDDRAIALTSQRSLDQVGGPDGFKKMDIELAEGWGAWGRAGGVEMTAHGLEFPKDVAIVVLHGMVSQEGPPRESWNALPVVATADGDRVEAFVDLGSVTVEPAEGSTVADGDQLAVTTTAGFDTWFIVDDGDTVMPALKDVDETGATWLSEPLSSIEPGVHSLTVIVVRDGIMARSFEYVSK
jgi:hypothetical protein